MSKFRMHWHVVVSAVLLILLTPLLSGFDVSHQVTILVDGVKKVTHSNAANPTQIVTEAGIVLLEGDEVQLEKGSYIKDGSVLHVLRAEPVTIVRGEEKITFKTAKKTVRDVLKQKGIKASKKKVYPQMSEHVTPEMTIYVLEKNEEFVHYETHVEPPVKYIEDKNLAAGIEKEEHSGKQGRAVVISKRVKSADGKHVVVEIGQRILEKPEPKVVRKGTARSVNTPDGPKKYTKMLRCSSTAYIATGNRTSIGIHPHRGIVAVDPRVIPYYTKLYIPGYGIAMAGDSGGAIKGNIVDVFMDSYSEAINWGRRSVEVYILED